MDKNLEKLLDEYKDMSEFILKLNAILKDYPVLSWIFKQEEIDTKIIDKINKYDIDEFEEKEETVLENVKQIKIVENGEDIIALIDNTGVDEPIRALEGIDVVFKYE